MKKLILCLSLIMFNASVASAEQQTNDEQSVFNAWCEAYAAEGLLTLAANRIYGHVSSLSDEGYQARKEWINVNYDKAAARFTERTDRDYMETYSYALENGWVQNCQLDDVIQ